MDRLSITQRKVLENLVAGRRETAGFPGGRSMSGGLSGTFASLRCRNLIGADGQISDAGRAALAKAEGRS